MTLQLLESRALPPVGPRPYTTTYVKTPNEKVVGVQSLNFEKAGCLLKALNGAVAMAQKSNRSAELLGC